MLTRSHFTPQPSQLKRENDDLFATIESFTDLIDLLKRSGLGQNKGKKAPSVEDEGGEDDGEEMIETEYVGVSDLPSGEEEDEDNRPMLLEYEYFDDTEVRTEHMCYEAMAHV